MTSTQAHFDSSPANPVPGHRLHLGAQFYGFIGGTPITVHLIESPTASEHRWKVTIDDISVSTFKMERGIQLDSIQWIEPNRISLYP